MERVLHRGSKAGVAAALAGAGIIAVTPVASSALGWPEVQEIGVQLTTAGVDDFTDIANAAASSTGLFAALGDNLALAADQLSNVLASLLALELPSAAGNLAAAVFNAIPAILENMLLAAVGGVLGQDFDTYIAGATVVVATWSDVVGELQSAFQDAVTHLSQAVQDIFAGDVASGLLQTLVGGNELLFDIPAIVVLGVPALLGDNLLGLVGL